MTSTRRHVGHTGPTAPQSSAQTRHAPVAWISRCSSAPPPFATRAPRHPVTWYLIGNVTESEGLCVQGAKAKAKPFLEWLHTEWKILYPSARSHLKNWVNPDALFDC